MNDEKLISFNSFLNFSDFHFTLFTGPSKGEEKTYFNLEKLSNFHLLFLVKNLKPDHFVEAVTSFVTSTLGYEFVTPSVFDLKDLYAESNSRTPVMFLLAPGLFTVYQQNLNGYI